MKKIGTTLSVLVALSLGSLALGCGGGEAEVTVQATTPTVTVQTQAPPQNYTEEWQHPPIRIGFPTGGAVVNEEAHRQIVEVVQTARSRTDIVRVRVEGHTDPRGEEGGNQQLSLQRAQAVAEIMVNEGVPREMIETVGYGSDQPLSSNSSAQDLSINRRVEFSILVRTVTQ